MYSTIEQAQTAAAEQSIERNTDIAVVSSSPDNFVTYAETNPELHEGEVLESVFRNGEQLDWSDVY